MRKWGSLGDIKRYEVVRWWILREGVLHPFMVRVSEGSVGQMCCEAGRGGVEAGP